MITTRIKHIRLRKLFLTFLPNIFHFKKPGTHNLDPDYFPGSPLNSSGHNIGIMTHHFDHVSHLAQNS